MRRVSKRRGNAEHRGAQPDNVNPDAPVPYDDLGGNELCACTGDLNFDGIVDVSDLLIVIGNWGVCP